MDLHDPWNGSIGVEENILTLYFREADLQEAGDQLFLTIPLDKMRLYAYNVSVRVYRHFGEKPWTISQFKKQLQSGGSKKDVCRSCVRRRRYQALGDLDIHGQFRQMPKDQQMAE